VLGIPVLHQRLPQEAVAGVWSVAAASGCRRLSTKVLDVGEIDALSTIGLCVE
jgi:hypothetical protein